MNTSQWFEIDVILDEYQTRLQLFTFNIEFEIDVILDEYQTFYSDNIYSL